MGTRFLSCFSTFLFFPAILAGQAANDPVVRFHTTLGDIDVELFQTTAPRTVANFLAYIDRPDYKNLLIYRSVPGFVIQAGGYQWVSPGAPSSIPAFPAIPNEYSVSNTRGTIAMAKLGGDPNSATEEWFFNEGDNSANLNSQNGGFTVFGKITNDAGLAVMDKIAAVPVYAYRSPFDNLPLLNANAAPNDSNVLLVTSIARVGSAPAIANNGVISAGAFGGYSAAAPGSYLEIYGTNLAGTTRGWATYDFSGSAAPNYLDGVFVTVGGRPAFVSFVSPTQINVQVPAGVTPGPSVPVVVTYAGQTSTAINIAINALEPGLLAPPAYLVGGKQYMAAFHADGSYVTNGKVPNISGSPAAAGESIVLYGVGFGPVTDTAVPVAGQIASGQTSLATATQFTIGKLPAPTTYAGLAPGYVGLYQFNVTVPAAAPAGDLALQVTQGSSPLPQTLYIPVQAAH
jgi:uncharacterized protein (TIGR03437 family)